MKKISDKNLWFIIAGLVFILLELLIVNNFLEQLNVFTYLLAVGFLPAVILFFSSFLYSCYSSVDKKIKYVLAIMLALIFSVIMLVYCGSVINSEIIDIIVKNSMTSDMVTVSMNPASAGDNIQSVLLFVAFSGVGAILGNKINRKRKKAFFETNISQEYDD
ncbi:MAG: hypothetical protein ACLRLD_05980 [Lachnospira sp.]